MIQPPSYPYTASVIVVSFNTRELLRECLQSLVIECELLPPWESAEVLVVDNASADGSAEMVKREFSGAGMPVRIIRNDVNLGFGVANNLAIEAAQGEYLVPLNSDAFFHPGALSLALAHMRTDPTVGIGGGRLVGREGEPQPSARSSPSIWFNFLVLSGLSDRFPHSRVFGAPERSWADPLQPADVGWLTGAFLIARREALSKAGVFDPRFFLYYEEVDLCRRVRAAGFRILYWPDIVVMHIGGESSRRLNSFALAGHAGEVVLWRMRSTFLYYRKHHGMQARLVLWLELAMNCLTRLRNAGSSDPQRGQARKEAAIHMRLLRRAWEETCGGRFSPPPPW